MSLMSDDAAAAGSPQRPAAAAAAAYAAAPLSSDPFSSSGSLTGLKSSSTYAIVTSDAATS